ncbi:MAG: hypothetical protein ABJJ25_12700 [Eudoraea sp.]|uniref:hypothetical protein n=1 Tax=Eudoraea sp. TaxID=1979955 RepID=UPI003265E811
MKNKLKFLVNRSNFLYHSYKEDPIYLNALLITSVNKKIINFLLKKGHFFNFDMDINIVLNHFEIWLIQFEEKEKKLCSISDRFVYKRVEQELPYPKKNN